VNRPFPEEFEAFYNECLSDLKARDNFSESFIPMLERYVTLTALLSKLNAEIVDEQVVVEHTNKANNKNQASSPKLRMFLALDSQANALARELKLSPATAPVVTKKDKKKGFDLKVA
jgi:hypothetical protein